MSKVVRIGWCSRTAAIPSAPDPVAWQTKPAWSRTASSRLRMSASSSITTATRSGPAGMALTVPTSLIELGNSRARRSSEGDPRVALVVDGLERRTRMGAQELLDPLAEPKHPLVVRADVERHHGSLLLQLGQRHPQQGLDEALVSQPRVGEGETQVVHRVPAPLLGVVRPEVVRADPGHRVQ